MSIRIVLADDHTIVREGVKLLLSNESSIKIVGEAENGREVLNLVKELTPHLVLMDINMPEMTGLECTRHVKTEFREVKVLIFSVYDNETYLADLLEAGADGYILKGSKKDELLFAINKVASGRMYVAPEFAVNLLTKKRLEEKIATKKNPPAEKIELTPREMEVLELIAQGLTNTEIANRLCISVRTIETRRKRLLGKTGTTNTATLIKFAVKNGLIE